MSRQTDDAPQTETGPIRFLIVTPTYRRAALLSRFLRRIRRQTYPNWRLIVVHDGPDPSVGSVVEQGGGGDPRIEFTHTPERSNDFGVGPRREGVRDGITSGGSDYCVFWDDDNLYARDALERIATALEKHGRPDLLLVPMKYRGRVLPPSGVAAPSLTTGQVDTGCLVVRPSLALAAHDELARMKREDPGARFYTQDYMMFDFLRRRDPPLRIEVAGGAAVGFHDGLRWGPYLRSMLGIPPLDLKKRLRSLRRGSLR